jgi:Zn-dependent alcohol dehydrogenase
MLASGQLLLGSLVTAKWPLQDIEEAIADAASGEQLKVLLIP